MKIKRGNLPIFVVKLSILYPILSTIARWLVLFYFRRIGTEGNLQSRRPLGPQLIAIADK